MPLLEDALTCSRCIISVLGEHAGESVAEIFERKIADITRTNKTFWVMRSPKAQPEQVREICRPTSAYTIFVEPAASGGARATTRNDVASEYSARRKIWNELPEDISPVTGKLDSGATALVLDMMTTTVSGDIDLWNYRDFSDAQKPLKFTLGCSTACAITSDMTSHPERMKSRYRGIVAVARLAEPYCVWLR